MPFVHRASNDQVQAVYEQYLYGVGEMALADPDLVAFFHRNIPQASRVLAPNRILPWPVFLKICLRS